MHRYTRLKFLIGILTLLAMVVTACAPAATPAPTTAPPAAEGTTLPTEAPTQAPAAESVELLFWDSWEEGGRSDAIEVLIANFEAANPNIKIEREFQQFDTMKTLVKTALASGTGPDVVSYGPGAGFMGPLVEAELLLPLDNYVDQYGWRDRIYPWTWESTTFDGQVYAVGNELEMIGVYYNKTIFEELGVQPPTNYDEFLAILEQAKAAGYFPLAFANKPGWPAFHMFSAFANNLAGKEQMQAVLAGEAKWTDQPFVDAIQMSFVELNEKGYFLPSPNALEYQEGNDLFYTGQAAMDLTGMWLLSDMLSKPEGFEVGFFALPNKAGAAALPPGGMGSATMVSKATPHPDEAAAFIDYLYSEEAAKVWYEVGVTIPPLDVDPAGYEMSGLFRFFVDTIRSSSTEGGLGLGYNIDVLTPPEFNTVMLDGFQAVLEGDRTPEEQAAALQAAFEAGQ